MAFPVSPHVSAQLCHHCQLDLSETLFIAEVADKAYLDCRGQKVHHI